MAATGTKIVASPAGWWNSGWVSVAIVAIGFAGIYARGHGWF